MPDCRACAIACFGPEEGYFFNSPGKWHAHKLPEGIQKLFDRRSIEEVYMMAMGPSKIVDKAVEKAGATESYIMVFRDALRNQLLVQRSGLPAELEKWLSPKGPGTGIARDIASLEVSLGPNGSYFALDKNGQSWAGLPTELEERIDERREANDWVRGTKPRNVSLGPHDTFVFLSESGTYTCYLGDEYPSLSEELEEAKLSSLKQVNIVLDPHHPGCFVLVRLDGTYLKKVPDSMEASCDVILSKLPNWQAQTEEKTKKDTGERAEAHHRHKKYWFGGASFGVSVIGAAASVAAAISGSSTSNTGSGGGGS